MSAMKMLVYVFLAVLLAVLAAQNSLLVEVSFMFLSWRVPLNIIVLVAAVSGFAAGLLVSFLAARRGGKRDPGPAEQNIENKKN